MRATCIAVLLLGLLLGLQLVATGAARADDWPRALACTFNTGNAATQTDGVFKQTPASPLAFEVRSIDLEGQAAHMITKAGAPPATVRIVRALNANHFIEVLNEGFLGLTTVYDKDASGLFPAVHSRHVGVFGQAVVAQYTGTCKAN